MQGPVWLDSLSCEGAESLEDCEHEGVGVTNCAHDEDVSVCCAEGADSSEKSISGKKSISVRLSDVESGCGRVEVRHG